MDELSIADLVNFVDGSGVVDVRDVGAGDEAAKEDQSGSG